MALETLAKPVIDALLHALDRAKDGHIKRGARKALAEAIVELIRIDPDVDAAEAKIAIAKAAGIIDKDVITAERMLNAARKPVKKKSPSKRGPARAKAAKDAAKRE